MSRAEPLTREEIVEVALARAVAGGLGSLSTRTLADELGVTPMALYRHVRNKDEIVDAVVDALPVGVGPPSVPRSDWPSSSTRAISASGARASSMPSVNGSRGNAGQAVASSSAS